MLAILFMVAWTALVFAGILTGQAFSGLISSVLGTESLGPTRGLALAVFLTSGVAYLAVKGRSVNLKKMLYSTRPTGGMLAMGSTAYAAMVVSNSVKGYAGFNAIQAGSAHVALWLSSVLTVLIFAVIGAVAATFVADSRYSRPSAKGRYAQS